MLTYMFIIMALIVATITPIFIRERKKRSFPTFTVLAVVVIIIAMIAVPMTSLINAVGDTSEFIACVDEFNDVHQNLYYDNALDKYFIVEADLWDLSKIQYREYLDTNLVKQYLEHKNAIASINLFN